MDEIKWKMRNPNKPINKDIFDERCEIENRNDVCQQKQKIIWGGGDGVRRWKRKWKFQMESVANVGII